MLYLHDVWVNWFEGEENGYNVCPFHEWRKEDTIELLDQVPLLKISTPLFLYIENQLSVLPEALLEDVYQKAWIRKNGERIQLDYCFVATDGADIIAVDTIGYQIPMRKSRLIPRQEQLVYEMTRGEDAKEFPIPQDEGKTYHILSPEPKYMIGLTRKERNMKHILFMALDQLKASKNTAEIRYWCTEWEPKNFRKIQKMSFEKAWNYLYDEVKHGWSERHEHLCEGLIKGQPFFERLWDMEKGAKVNWDF